MLCAAGQAKQSVRYALYNLLAITRCDVEKRRAQHERNFVFFDAPVGMIFTIDRRPNTGL